MAVSCGDPSAPISRPVAASITLSADSLSLIVGDSAIVWFEARDGSGRLMIPDDETWTVSVAGIASANRGAIKATAAGRTWIIVRSGTAADSLDIEVLPPISGITLRIATDTLYSLKETAAVYAVAMAGNKPRQGRFTFTIRNEGVLGLESTSLGDGMSIRSKAPGTSWVVATEAGGLVDSAFVVVKPRIAQLFLDVGVGGAAGRTITPSLRATDAKGQPVADSAAAFSVADTTIATVTSARRLLLKRVGSTMLEVTAPGALRAQAELDVVPFPALGVVMHTNVLPDAGIFVGTGQIARGIVYPGGPLAEPTITAEVLDTGVADISMRVVDGAWNVTIVGKRPARTKIVFSSPLMRPDTITTLVSTSRPWLHLPLQTKLHIMAGETAWMNVNVTDSLEIWRELASSPTATVESSDSTVLRVRPSSRQLAIDSASSQGPSAELEGVAPGQAIVRVTIPGFGTSERLFEVTAGPVLRLMPRGVTVMGANQTTARAPGSYGRSWQLEIGNRPDTVRVTLQHSNPAVGRFVNELVIPATQSSIVFDVDALSAGVDTIVATATGFRPDTTILVVSTPRFVVGDTTRVYMHADAAFSIGIADTVGGQWAPLTDLEVRGISADSSIGYPLATTIPKGWHGGWPITYVIKDTGKTRFTFSDAAGMLAPISVPVHVPPDSSLRLFVNSDLDLAYIGQGQRFDEAVYAAADNYLAEQGIPISVVSSDTAVLRVAPQLAPLPQVNVPGTVAGLVGGSMTGTARLAISAPGYATRYSRWISVGRPRFRLTMRGDSVPYFRDDSVRLTLMDSRGRPRKTDIPISATVRLLGGGMPDVRVAIPPGASVVSVPVRLPSRGRSRLVVTDDGTGPFTYLTDTAIVHAFAYSLVAFDSTPFTLGVGQTAALPFYRLDYEPRPTTVTGVSLRGRFSSAALPMDSAKMTETVKVVGVSVGVDTLVLSAPGYAADSLRVVVTAGRIQLPGLPNSLKAKESYTLRVVSADSTGRERTVAAATSFSLASTGSLQITDQSGAAISSIMIEPGTSSSVSFILKASASGPAEFTVSRLDYVPFKRSVNVVP